MSHDPQWKRNAFCRWVRSHLNNQCQPGPLHHQTWLHHHQLRNRRSLRAFTKRHTSWLIMASSWWLRDSILRFVWPYYPTDNTIRYYLLYHLLKSPHIVTIYISLTPHHTPSVILPASNFSKCSHQPLVIWDHHSKGFIFTTHSLFHVHDLVAYTTIMSCFSAAFLGEWDSRDVNRSINPYLQTHMLYHGSQESVLIPNLH